jgi:SAM-dependent methyltransferase
MLHGNGSTADRADRAAAYDRWHSEHSSGQGPWYDMAIELLTTRPELLRNARVLEIGCGWGDFSAWMASRGAGSVTGEDFSTVAIDTARSRHHAAGLQFNVGDIESVAHPAGSFDLVVSCETIEHVRNPRRAVCELARVLRPGGTLLLSTPNYLSTAGAHRVFREATGRKWDEGGQPFVGWTMYPRTVAWVRGAGLRIVSKRGDGWYLPVPRRPGGFSLRPPRRLRRWVKLVALHILVEARKVDG